MSLDGITVDVRTYKGSRVRWVYHDACDDGRPDSDGHMQVRNVENSYEHDCDYEYRCKACGFSVPYSEIDVEQINSYF